MNETTDQTLTEERLIIPFSAAQENTAVALCCVAYQRARKRACATHRNRYDAKELAIKAYKEAMPAVYGRDRIRDFVACVTQGALMEVFTDSECKRLLHAAQIAHSAADRPPQKPPTAY